MKVKMFFKIGIICISVFCFILTYFWYVYFRDFYGDMLSKNVRLEIINNGKINYINAIPNDDKDIIPTYYFRVRNNVDVPLSYEIYLTDINPSNVNDGCTESTSFKREELNYELKLDNKVISQGALSSLKDDILDVQNLEGTKVNDYSLRIWINEKNKTSLGKHYHYVVNIREK